MSSFESYFLLLGHELAHDVAPVVLQGQDEAAAAGLARVVLAPVPPAQTLSLLRGHSTMTSSGFGLFGTSVLLLLPPPLPDLTYFCKDW